MFRRFKVDKYNDPFNIFPSYIKNITYTDDLVESYYSDFVDIDFPKTNIQEVIKEKIREYRIIYRKSPNTLYLNYDGYKALLGSVNNEDCLNFADKYLGLDIVLVPDKVENKDFCHPFNYEYYIEVSSKQSTIDLFKEILSQRVQNKIIV